RYKREIAYVIDNDISATDEVKKQWKELTGGKVTVHKANAAAVSPLLGEIKWDQGPIYNDSCPYDPTAYSSYNYKCPGGCVAVAMAQIMKYWGYPTKGTGSKCYWAEYGNGTNNYGNYGRLCANFENVTYNYNLMPDKLTSSTSSAEKRAVAQLIYHCGVALNMQYGPKSSGAYTLQTDYWIDRPDGANNPYIDARTAFKRYFGYSQAEGIYKDDYTETAWIEILKEQLSNWQPVLYAGRTSNNAGHAFVCDGYDENDFFHINWGWGGSYNCYTTVSSLLPEGHGTGGGSDAYNEDQKIIINIRATKDEKTIGWVYSKDYAESYYSVDTTAFRLLPDTCLRVYTNLSNFSASSNVHGMGMTFDPYSKTFGGGYYGSALFDKSYPYRLDTLQIAGFYLLGQNGYNAAHPDTLRIYLSYYEPYSELPSNGDYRIVYLSNPYYSCLLPNVSKTGGNLQKGDKIRPVASNTIVINYVLTKEDTALEDYYENIKIPITYNNATVNGFEVPAGAVIGTMVKFIPGYDYNLGDTLYYGVLEGNEWANGYPVHLKNSFGIFCFEGTDNDFVDENGYNGMNVELTDLRYQMYHSFLDSCYSLNNNYLPCMAYHITYDIVPTHAKLEIDTVVCGKEYVYDGFTYKESGVYTRRFYTPAGDSITVINLTLHEPVGVIGNIQGDSVITQAGIRIYSIAPVTNAAVYQWEISNPKWIITGSGTQIALDIKEKGAGILSVKAIHANGVCASEAVLTVDFCDYLGVMTEIQGEHLIRRPGTYTYSIDPVENAVSYLWEISNPKWYIIGTSTQPTVDLYIDDSISSGTLSVKAIDNCGYYSEKTFDIQSNVSVLEYEANNAIQIYPNPAEDVVYVSIENNTLDNIEIYLFDVFGRRLDIQKITDKTTAINMSSFSAGVYILQIKESNRIIKSSKVVKVE
ncbi:MAG: C10 family peptidase, partial [Bacteroidales bacterium]|nr:C10 family peptidase [Bacteroidales bacterium]